MVLKAIIIGAGPGGLCTAIALKKQLGSNIDLTIYERAGDVGGTWLNTTYPGCGCDIPSHVYSFSFELNPDWSEPFAKRREIHSYFVNVARKYDLYPHVRFNTQWLSASFNENTSKWHVTLQEVATPGATPPESFEVTADILISATGPFSTPSYPSIPGWRDFKGQAIHSARWDEGVDLMGKRVAVVGSAASAVQLVPEIAPLTSHLTIFQRTPNWFLPRAPGKYSETLKWFFRNVPGLLMLWRIILYYTMDLEILAFRQGSLLSRIATWESKSHMTRLIRSPTLRSALIPKYAFGCKRVVYSDAYLSTVQRDTTTFVTCGIDRFTPSGIVDSEGAHHEIDVVIYATGYKVQSEPLKVPVYGRNGISMSKKWEEGINGMAYFGVCMSGFPNFYTILGPNSGVGHNSILGIIESQANLISNLITEQSFARIPTMEVSPIAESRYFTRIQAALSKYSVWAVGGCKSWYKSESGGHITANWPWSLTRFWWETRRVAWGDFMKGKISGENTTERKLEAKL